MHAGFLDVGVNATELSIDHTLHAVDLFTELLLLGGESRDLSEYGLKAGDLLILLIIESTLSLSKLFQRVAIVLLGLHGL